MVVEAGIKRVGFLGSGMMARALAGGLISSGYIKKEDVYASDRYEGCRTQMAALGVTVTESNAEVANNAGIIFVAVKPNDVEAVLKQTAESLTKDNLVVSIAAGVTIASLEAMLPEGTRVVRVMPNTPALVCAVAAGVAAGTAARPEDLDTVVSMLGTVGTAMAVEEGKLDAVTGLSGSGPAYGFLAIEALADGGVRAGLSRDVALKLAAQTMLGAAKMVLETGKHPGELKDQVCSPGGTTIAGVHALETNGFRVALIDAVMAASTRATELGKK